MKTSIQTKIVAVGVSFLCILTPLTYTPKAFADPVVPYAPATSATSAPAPVAPTDPAQPASLAGSTAVQVGDFKVSGGVQNYDYSYQNKTLTIKTNTPLTISGTSSTDHIELTPSINANLTLDNLTINYAADDAVALKALNASAHITLVGTNILTATGTGRAGLRATRGSTITIDGSGSLTAQGGTDGAGIGGNNSEPGGKIIINSGTIVATGGKNSAGIGGSFNAAGGDVTINGGEVTANGGLYAAGIGGGLYGNGGTITITAGTVTARGNNGGAGLGGGAGQFGTSGGSAAGNGGVITVSGGSVFANGGDAEGNGAGRSIGAGAKGKGVWGSPGTFSTTGSGHAFIQTNNAIGDTSQKANWNGVIVQGDEGSVFGTSITLTENATLGRGKTLTVDKDKTLTIGNSTTFTNNSIIVNKGIITTTGSGKVTGSGTITNNATTLALTTSLDPSSITYDGDFDLTATLTLPSYLVGYSPAPSGSITFASNGKTLGSAEITGEVHNSSIAATCKVSTAQWQGGSLVAGLNNLTATYVGDGSWAGSQGSLSITIAKATPPAPTLTGVAETSYGKHDGTITGLSTFMEYATTKEGSYTPVSSASMTFAPGTYWVRMAKDANHNPSDPAEVTIDAASAPSLSEQTIYNNPDPTYAHTVTITGMLSKGATLRTTPLVDQKPVYDKLSALASQDGLQTLAAYDVVLNGSYEGALDLAFKIGSAYNGQTITLYHEKSDGTTETLHAKAEQGWVALTVDGLSPYLIAAPKNTTPPTPSAHTPGSSAAGVAAPTTTPSGLAQTGDKLAVGGIALVAVAFGALAIGLAIRQRIDRRKNRP